MATMRYHHTIDLKPATATFVSHLQITAEHELGGEIEWLKLGNTVWVAVRPGTGHRIHLATIDR